MARRQVAEVDDIQPEQPDRADRNDRGIARSPVDERHLAEEFPGPEPDSPPGGAHLHLAPGYEIHAVAGLSLPHHDRAGAELLHLQETRDLRQRRRAKALEERQPHDQVPALEYLAALQLLGKTT